MKKATLSFLLFTSLLSSESLRSRYFYDSVLSCDEVKEKIIELKKEKRRKWQLNRDLSYQGTPWELGIFLPFIAFDQIDSINLEDRLKNLKELEKEKCKKINREDIDEYFSK